MATVYKALDRTSGRVVVLKKVHTYDPERRERFTAEARLAAGVAHPNVVQVLHVTDDSLVAEWVEGADLEDVVADVGALPPELAAFVAHETALGLGAVHAAGILHRDVSAANVLLSLEGEVKLTDFGLASLAGDAGEEVRGTLGTMAPEVVRGDAPGPAADLFSLGAVLVHALTGRPPFAGGDASETLDAVLHQNPAAALEGRPADSRRPGRDRGVAAREGPGLEAGERRRTWRGRLSAVLEALGSPGPGHLASFLAAPGAYRPPSPPRKKPRRALPPPAPPRPAAEPEPAPERRSRRTPLLVAAVVAVGLAGIVFATRGPTDGAAPAAVAEEPPAVRPLEVATRRRLADGRRRRRPRGRRLRGRRPRGRGPRPRGAAGPDAGAALEGGRRRARDAAASGGAPRHPRRPGPPRPRRRGGRARPPSARWAA